MYIWDRGWTKFLFRYAVCDSYSHYPDQYFATKRGARGYIKRADDLKNPANRKVIK